MLAAIVMTNLVARQLAAKSAVSKGSVAPILARVLADETPAAAPLAAAPAPAAGGEEAAGSPADAAARTGAPPTAPAETTDGQADPPAAKLPVRLYPSATAMRTSSAQRLAALKALAASWRLDSGLRDKKNEYLEAAKKGSDDKVAKTIGAMSAQYQMTVVRCQHLLATNPQAYLLDVEETTAIEKAAREVLAAEEAAST
mmetsp:Transcript_27132/g.68552  ORF Transcript_27132/g.68552 Transcript_27132/m.68552 type:complete len:200 (+) Transcript_27132:759-1358(+)